MPRKMLRLAIAVVLTLALVPGQALGWSNGPEEGGVVGDGYGTHDWILDEALDLLGSSWVDRDVALLATDDPDSVLGLPDKPNHTFVELGDYRGGPQRVADLHYAAVLAYNDGDIAEASRLVGLLSHYYSDLSVPFHTYYEDGKDAIHLDYELDVDENHRAPGDASTWITPAARQPVTDVRQQAVGLALASRATYPVVANYSSLTSTVLATTKTNLSRAANGLADIIASIPTDAGVSGPGNLSAYPYREYVSNNATATTYAACANANGAPIEGVRITFSWPLKSGTVTDVVFTDPEGVAKSQVRLGTETLNQPIVVTATSTSGGASDIATTSVTPTDVIDYIKTGVSNYSPMQRTLLTARTVILNASGKPIPDLNVTFTWTFKSSTVTYTTTTDRWGVAMNQRNIGSAATDYRISVMASVQAGGTTRTSTATFLPKENPDGSLFSPSSVSGTNRFATAAAISKRAFPNGSTYVIIATGRNFPDALGGAALAGGYEAPILLTDKGWVPPDITAEIKRLAATDAIILGGTGAVGTSAEAQLRSAGIKRITRVQGSTRYETARAIARAAIKKADDGWDGTAFVATGSNFPDALAASPIAAARRWPIYLAEPGGSASVLASQMKSDGVKRVIILGGTNVVSAGYETALEAGIGDVERLAGGDRYATGALIASYGVDSAGLIWDGVSVATGANFPDALAGGMLGAKKGSVIVLTTGNALHDEAARCLSRGSETIGTVYYLGGTSVLSTSVRNEIAALIN